jgi:general secretion pathway protein E
MNSKNAQTSNAAPNQQKAQEAANPADVARYLVEFYNLARSVKKAAQLGTRAATWASVRATGRTRPTNRQFDANDRTSSTSSTGCGSTPSSSAPATSTSNRGANMGIVRFRIDGVLHQVYQIPMSVMAAMVSRIKILGRMDVVEKRRPQDGRIKTRTPDGGRRPSCACRPCPPPSAKSW